MTADVPNAGAERNGDGLSGVGRYAGTPESVQGNSAALREALADVLDVSLAEAGYRRVVEDDDTIERLARTIHDAECGTDDLCKGYDAHGEWDRRLRDDAYESVARAVVRALREDT